jgi:hypothetical protein
MSMFRNDETEGETGSETTNLVSRRVSPANSLMNHVLDQNETTKRISTHSPHTPQWVAWVKPSAPVVMVCACACGSCSVSEQGHGHYHHHQRPWVIARWLGHMVT